MVSPGMMSRFPSRRNNGALADFDDAITCRKPNSDCRLNKLDMGPLEPVIVHIISNFAKEHSFFNENSISLRDERGIEMSKIVALIRSGFEYESESAVEVLLPVLALIRYMGRVVDDDIEDG